MDSRDDPNIDDNEDGRRYHVLRFMQTYGSDRAYAIGVANQRKLGWQVESEWYRREDGRAVTDVMFKRSGYDHAEK